MKKINILHVGGHHSVHVTDIVTELSKSPIVGDQVLFGYKLFLVPGYTCYNYPYAGKYSITKELIDKVSMIFKSHKIDIVILHSLYNTSSVFSLINVPSILIPWSVPISSTIKNNKQWECEKKTLEGTNSILFPNLKGLEGLKNFYNINKDLDFVKFHTLIPCVSGDRLESSIARILSPRTLCERYGQTTLLSALKRLYNIGVVDFKCVFLSGQSSAFNKSYVNMFKRRAGTLEIPNITVIDKALSKTVFFNLLLENDIFVSLTTHDGGYAGTNFSILSSGGILIAPKSNSLWMDIIDRKNYIAFKDGSEDDLLVQLQYAINNKLKLQQLFGETNKHFKEYDSILMIKALERTITKWVSTETT